MAKVEKRQRKVKAGTTSGVNMVAEVVEAFSASVEEQSKKSDCKSDLLAFRNFRQLWTKNDLTRRVLEQVHRESKVAKDACVSLQKLFHACLQNATFAPKGKGPRLQRSARDKFREMTRHCAGIYAAYVIYAIQPVHPKVRIYLPYPKAEELLHVLWDLRCEARLHDCHRIAQELASDDAFVFGALNKDKPRTSSEAQKKKGLTFENWKEVKAAEEVAKSCLDDVEGRLERERLEAYYAKIKAFGVDPVDLPGKIATLQAELRKDMNSLMQTRIDRQTSRPPTNQLFGQRKRYEFQQGSSGVEDKEPSTDELIAALPARWRKRIREAEEKKRMAELNKRPPSRGRKRGRRKAEAPVEDEDPSTEDLFDGYDADEVGDDDDLARELEEELDM